MVEALGFAIVRESCNFLMQVVVWAAIFIVVFSSWWMALFSLQGIPRHPDMGQVVRQLAAGRFVFFLFECFRLREYRPLL